jgi:predicted P-loop ATPase
MAGNLIAFPPPDAEELASAETERKRRLFQWADVVLKALGFADRVAHAGSLDDLRKIVFDVEAAEVTLAIREALHPASGERVDDCFTGLRQGGLKQILKKRFAEAKTQREQELRNRRAGGQQTNNLDWTDELKLDADGGVRPILSNLILYLRHHHDWQGALAFDEFNACVAIRKRPPWGEEKPDTHWTDHHESLTRVWFQNQDINATLGDVGRAVQAAARANLFHAVREFLEALAWDGTPRIDNWLVTYFHAEDGAYIRAIGPRYLISAVARIYQPGAQVDHTPIFEGPQGKLKSTALRTLAVKDIWFTDRLSNVSNKDAAIEIAGVWFVEIAEMDAVIRASTSGKKSFLTRRVDRFRPPYGRHPIKLARQCVFAGTINPPVGGYLTDDTGARRFWPVACHGTIDRDGIERDRDQLWAEAVMRFKAGEKWWLETPKLEALATAEQAKRFKHDAWEEPIERWIGRRKDVSMSEVLQGALGIEPQDQSRSAQMRVASILTHLGFEKYRPRKGDKRSNRYWKPS